MSEIEKLLRDAFIVSASDERGHYLGDMSAKAALSELAAMRERTIAECEAIARQWLSIATMQLRAGEMTAQEIRAVKAVARSIAGQISALRASPPPRAVKVDVSKEWCIAAAEQEGDLSIGAGAPSPPSDEDLPTADDVRGILGPPSPSQDETIKVLVDALEKIRDAAQFEMAIDPTWAPRTASAALALVRKGE